MMVQSGFHKDDDGDLHERILRIEAYIEELADVAESCRKLILVSKFAAAAVVSALTSHVNCFTHLREAITSAVYRPCL